LNILIDFAWQLASFGGGVWVELENGTVFDTTAIVGAFVHGSLQDVTIPSHKEVTVKPVAGWVTLGPDERLAVAIPHVLELVGVPDDLVEDRDKVDWMSIWATTAIVGVNREGHVRFVVGRV